VSAGVKGLVRAAVVALLALALDQITKAIVRAEISPGERIDLIAGIDLVRVSNDGIAFGLLDDAGGGVLVLAGGAFVLLLAYFLASSEQPRLWLPLGLLAGGALGNLVDRIDRGAVTDFIDPPNWPAFNVADIEITLGVALLVLLFMRGGDSRAATAEGPEPGGEPEGDGEGATRGAEA
jgi:signal peptidase II